MTELEISAFSIDWSRPPKNPDAASLRQLRSLVDLAKAIGPEWDELLEVIRADRQMKAAFRRTGFQWAEHYSLSVEELTQLQAASIGLPNLLARAEASLPEGYTLQELVDAVEIPESIDPGAAMGVVGLLFALRGTLECLALYGAYMHELVAGVDRGEDKAFFDAVRVDPVVLGNPILVRRLAVAVVESDAAFMRKLQLALRGKTEKQQKNLRDIRFALRAMIEAGSDHASDAELYRLFTEQLAIYPKSGAPKNLRKHLAAQRKRVSTTSKR